MSPWFFLVLILLDASSWLLVRSTIRSMSARLDIQSKRLDTATEQTERLRKCLETVANNHLNLTTMISDDVKHRLSSLAKGPAK